MRINRYLAAAGFGSRRACEELVRAGKVTINGARCDNLATVVGPDDHVKVGARLVRAERRIYALLQKPRGYVCSASDEAGRKTVFDLVPRDWPRLFHVGRLDKDSEGLLILTNDGGWAQKLAHPSHGLEKEYEVLLDGPYDAAKTPKLLHGVVLEQGRARAERVRVLASDVISIVLKQGLKRQVREMLYRVGFEVKRLCRVRIGPLRDPELPQGSWRLLSAKEVADLSAAAKPSARPGRPAAKPGGAVRSTAKGAPRDASPARGRR